jgi:hypothetical protein
MDSKATALNVAEKKMQFMHEEIWMLTIAGAFQRAKVYKREVKEKAKKEFKDKLQDQLVAIAKQYAVDVTEKKHLENIYTICQLKDKNLKAGSLNFGISQKLLNLYLKYLWCLGQILPPPHFPVDSIIQTALKREARKFNLESKEPFPWTKIKNEKDYLAIIDYARKVMHKRGGQDLATMELELFGRRQAE